MKKILQKLHIPETASVLWPIFEEEFESYVLGAKARFHIVTKDLELAKRLFRTMPDVFLQSESLYIENGFALSICHKADLDLLWFCLTKTTSFKGSVVARFNYDPSEYPKIIDRLKDFHAYINQAFAEDNTLYVHIVLDRFGGLLSQVDAKRQIDLLRSPKRIEDIGQIELPKGWFGSTSIKEMGVPAWKREILLESSSLYDELLGHLKKRRFFGSVVKMPNKEQTAVLMAAGRFNGEVRLKDGRLFMFKGTEEIDFEDRPAYDASGEIKHIRRVAKRVSALYGLDLTNGVYVKFRG